MCHKLLRFLSTRRCVRERERDIRKKEHIHISVYINIYTYYIYTYCLIYKFACENKEDYMADAFAGISIVGFLKGVH